MAETGQMASDGFRWLMIALVYGQFNNTQPDSNQGSHLVTV